MRSELCASLETLDTLSVIPFFPQTGTFIDRKKCTRRELRTGAFFAWPMLYGWIYPQLMMVLMIMVTYACIAPLLMPFGVIFFMFSYVMYKYQLLYVYVNDNQSLGYMWYAVFNYTMVAFLFAAVTLLGFFGVHMSDMSPGPFFFTLPLPVAISYFWHYCDSRFKKTSMVL
jgi:calcium permeable stress-gated cation channel